MQVSTTVAVALSPSTFLVDAVVESVEISGYERLGVDAVGCQLVPAVGRQLVEQRLVVGLQAFQLVGHPLSHHFLRARAAGAER
ncbi:MAG: hypothetical protein ACLSIH_10540 [Eggerthella lenta]